MERSHCTRTWLAGGSPLCSSSMTMCRAMPLIIRLVRLILYYFVADLYFMLFLATNNGRTEKISRDPRSGIRNG
jgi:hypothetical protein